MEEKRIQEYLKVLACPKCKSEVFYKNFEDKEGFYCKSCKILFPIIEDIPVMLLEEAISVLINEENESS